MERFSRDLRNAVTATGSTPPETPLEVLRRQSSDVLAAMYEIEVRLSKVVDKLLGPIPQEALTEVSPTGPGLLQQLDQTAIDASRAASRIAGLVKRLEGAV